VLFDFVKYKYSIKKDTHDDDDEDEWMELQRGKKSRLFNACVPSSTLIT